MNQAPNPNTAAKLFIEQAIAQVKTLESTQTGWQLNKLRQTQGLLKAALESMQTLDEADPEWEALLKE